MKQLPEKYWNLLFQNAVFIEPVINVNLHYIFYIWCVL